MCSSHLKCNVIDVWLHSNRFSLQCVCVWMSSNYHLRSGVKFAKLNVNSTVAPSKGWNFIIRAGIKNWAISHSIIRNSLKHLARERDNTNTFHDKIILLMCTAASNWWSVIIYWHIPCSSSFHTFRIKTRILTYIGLLLINFWHVFSACMLFVPLFHLFRFEKLFTLHGRDHISYLWMTNECSIPCDIFMHT